MQTIQLLDVCNYALPYLNIMLIFQLVLVYVYLSARIILVLEYTLIILQGSVRSSVI